MTTFAEMQTLVYAQTKRPELVDLTKTAIRLATTRAHRTEFFPRDGEVISVDYTPTNSSPFIDIPNIYSVFTRLRAIDVIQSIDPVTFLPTDQPFEYRDKSDTYDQDNNLRYNSYTIVGSTITLVPSIQTGKVKVWYFKNPVVTEGGYSSWIADEYPEELAMWAATIIQMRNGYEAIAKSNVELHVQPFKESLIENHFLPVTRS